MHSPSKGMLLGTPPFSSGSGSFVQCFASLSELPFVGVGVHLLVPLRSLRQGEELI